MLYPTLEYVTRVSREIAGLPEVIVSDELRGWSWRDSPIVSTQEVVLGVSDITSGFCESGRDVYLRYVKRVKPQDNEVLELGRLIHNVFHRLIESVKGVIYSRGMSVNGDILEKDLRLVGEKVLKGLGDEYPLLKPEVRDWVFRRLWGEGVRTYSAALDSVRSRSRYLTIDSIVSAVVPVITEFPIDGSLIGLSRALRIDALLLPSLLMEIKSRPPKHVFEIALAGYALAMESQYSMPVNYGLLTYVKVRPERKELLVRPKLVMISDQLREEFIEMRDRRKEIVAYGIDPSKSDGCPPECPFRKYCMGE